jgi:cytochrome c oxidase subunit 1|tara:strand:+ start:3870 stop:5810 length:1941 start_codon:yes stop_codon:yes gene_type:complete
MKNQNTNIYKRPKNVSGILDLITTVDHKKIGVMYLYTGFTFFLVGGLEALLIRIHLMQAESTFLSAAEYNSLFTVHGFTMVFLFFMAVNSGFGNYIIPLMIGARDVAFPRMNALGYWIYFFGAIFIHSTLFVGTTAPPIGGHSSQGSSLFSIFSNALAGGWFLYQPNAGTQFSPGTATDIGVLGVIFLGVASLISAINLTVTTLNLRTKGLKLMKLPVYVWMTQVTSFLLIFSLPFITIALFTVLFDRQLGGNFYIASMGGDPILWQHLFWLFGHPEVYILILPVFGIMSEIIPVFSRKPVFGYATLVFAGFAIGFIGFGVWAHHMFSSSMPPLAQAGFGAATMIIAIPTGIKIFNWIATMWFGKRNLNVSMLFSISFIINFVIGGVSGVTHAVVPSVWQQTDTYYIIGHFHYILVGGGVFAIFAGIYYWFPLVFGKFLNEKIGKIHFWLIFLGVHVTFLPQHWLGLQGMVRRTWWYDKGMNIEYWNFVSSIGAIIILLSLIVFIFNWIFSVRKGEEVIFDPWDGRTLEWSVPLPPPEYNFYNLPKVSQRDDFWYKKYKIDENNRSVPRTNIKEIKNKYMNSASLDESHIVLPSRSYYPFTVGLSLPFLGWAFIFRGGFSSMILLLTGVLILISSIVGWSLEPEYE